MCKISAESRADAAFSTMDKPRALPPPNDEEGVLLTPPTIAPDASKTVPSSVTIRTPPIFPRATSIF